MKKKSVVISVPVNKIKIVAKLLGYPIAEKQIPIVKIRVDQSQVVKIRKAIKNG